MIHQGNRGCFPAPIVHFCKLLLIDQGLLPTNIYNPFPPALEFVLDVFSYQHFFFATSMLEVEACEGESRAFTTMLCRRRASRRLGPRKTQCWLRSTAKSRRRTGAKQKKKKTSLLPLLLLCSFLCCCLSSHLKPSL